MVAASQEIGWQLLPRTSRQDFASWYISLWNIGPTARANSRAELDTIGLPVPYQDRAGDVHVLVDDGDRTGARFHPVAEEAANENGRRKGAIRDDDAAHRRGAGILQE